MAVKPENGVGKSVIARQSGGGGLGFGIAVGVAMFSICTHSKAVKMAVVDVAYTARAVLLGPFHEYQGYVPKPGDQLELLRVLPESSEWFDVNYVVPRRPVHIRSEGGLQALRWQTHKWNAKYLKARAGDITVAIENPGGQSPMRKHKFLAEHQHHGVDPNWTELKFGELLDNISAQVAGGGLRQSFYMNLQRAGFNSVVGPMARLSNDISIPPFFLTRPIKSINMWLGNSLSDNGTKSRLHSDTQDNIYALIRGKKKIVLIPPSDAEKVSTSGFLLGVMTSGVSVFSGIWPAQDPTILDHFSLLDTEYFNREAFPMMTEVTKIIVDVEPGDLLFIPAGWLHEVTSFDTNIAINFWADPPGGQFMG